MTTKPTLWGGEMRRPEVVGLSYRNLVGNLMLCIFQRMNNWTCTFPLVWIYALIYKLIQPHAQDWLLTPPCFITWSYWSGCQTLPWCICQCNPNIFVQVSHNIFVNLTAAISSTFGISSSFVILKCSSGLQNRSEINITFIPLRNWFRCNTTGRCTIWSWWLLYFIFKLPSLQGHQIVESLCIIIVVCI